MRPWLIQRAHIESRPERKGIDSILRLDYMGSAEFECGSVRGSFKRIQENLAQYAVFDLKVCKGKTLTVGCKEAVKEDVKFILKTLSNGDTIHLKERSGLLEWAHQKYMEETNFWWDIDNDWMAWEKDDEFAVKLKHIIQNKPAL